LNNAAKYTEPGGRIDLTAELAPSPPTPLPRGERGKGEGEVVIRIRDSGIGIAAELLPRIFDWFTQADASLARTQGGLGIGLTLVRKLVELMGGQVSAHSAGPGQGSEFVVRFPALPTRPRETPLAPTEKSRPCGRPLRVLVVEDSPIVAEVLFTLLKMWGHHVRAVEDGHGALVAARTYQPDVILLDIGLPGMNGYDVARQLRQEAGRKRPLIAAMTGYGRDEDRRRSQEAGFDCHLVKPVDPDVLEAFLATAEADQHEPEPTIPGAT
jgi:CheY-like chemotaxis protein